VAFFHGYVYRDCKAVVSPESWVRHAVPGHRRVANTLEFTPETPRSLGEIFDEVWAAVAPDFGDNEDAIETARMRLASIILDLARDGQYGSLQIARTSLRLIRRTLPTAP
jgi:hypothetical protein